MMKKELLLWIPIFFAWNEMGECKKRKTIVTMLDAKWNQSPLILEISEFLAEENNNYFWSFVDSVSAGSEEYSKLGTIKEQYEFGLNKASDILKSESKIRMLKFALSLHSYSPRIEMYSQMAEQEKLPCSPSVVIGSQILCSVDEMDKVLKMSGDEIENKPEIYRIDHHYPGSVNHSKAAVLYGELGGTDFSTFHGALKKYASENQVDYIFRHHVQNRLNQRVRLSGYGVELQMKSTEYKAEDDSSVTAENSAAKQTDDEDEDDDEDDEPIDGFDFKRLKELYPELKKNLANLKADLMKTSHELTPLKVWQFQELSLQAAQKIMNQPSGKSRLDTFVYLSQNFPTQTRSLLDIRTSAEMKKEIMDNQMQFTNTINIQPGEAALLINGLYFDIELLDVLTIMETIRQEMRSMDGLHSIGIIDQKLTSSLLALDFSRSASPEYALDIRDSAIMWFNDLERDGQYKRWSSTLMDLMKPTFPGMLRSIRKNLFNLVVFCDPANRDCWPLLRMAESFILYNAPIRVGAVFSVPPKPASGKDSASVALLNAVNYVIENKNPGDALSFVTDVYASITEEDRNVTVEDVRKKLISKFYGVDADDVLGPDSDYNTGRELAADFISRSGLRSLPQALLNGVALPKSSLTKDDLEDAMLTEIMTQTRPLQKAIYMGELTDSDNVVDHIMSSPNVMPRLNSRVLNDENDIRLRLTDTQHDQITKDMFYINKNEDVSATTLWIIADFATQAGIQLLTNAIKYLYEETSNNVRISIMVNPATESCHKINSLLLAAIKNKKDVLPILAAAKDILNGKINIADFDILREGELEFFENLIAKQKRYISEIVSFKAGECGVVANGRVIGPFEENELFISADYVLLEKHSANKRATKIYKILRDHLDSTPWSERSDIVMKAISLLSSSGKDEKTRIPLTGVRDKYSVIKVAPFSDSEPVFEIVGIADPASHGAQKLGQILSVLGEVLNADLKIYMNCVERLSDMPLKSYYRFVLEKELTFEKNGDLSAGPIAEFNQVAYNSLLTQIMHVPENWLVEVVVSPYDLDNIRLKDIESSIRSQFELEYLLVEGHCFDIIFGMPTRGLQITLGTKNNPVIVDTIVMANLGYFQLKANPGAWILRLRQGRSADLYDIVSHVGTDTPPNSTDIKVLIGSFQSTIVKLKVTKKPDKVNEELLSDDSATNEGIWNSITNTLTGSKPEETAEDKTINIFSLASGHLYERLMRIMMLSVLKHTKSPVKFWFLKNYLSPSFKDFLPRMAKEYGFQYEFVQYKWPRWLNQQTEKQRIIWGYKILFLDVLFPLDVKKIIFVDADQVVRADLKELVDLDLNGAPYGYTPFCDSRKEMDGFRFWKHGYWKTHLQSRRYHISALYVVDLKRFRKIAAGDRLRGQYQALSQDPNSLSNLDQDLPNNMIHQVPIKSLPQEWLWCETWCDDASKEKAKTIDLCNNPQTKEAKLSAAVRIVSEWKDYDEEIKRLMLRMDDHVEDEKAANHQLPPDTAKSSQSKNQGKTIGKDEL